jgi:endonuclease/exonuclease/phosphatase family metal-dependent hydrolase
VAWRFKEPDRPRGRRDAIKEALTRVAPDVLCLQEVYADRHGADDARELGAALGLDYTIDGYRWHGEKAFGNAIVARWDVIEEGVQELDAHRRAVWAVLDAPFGRVPVISTHLSHRFDASKVREAEAQELMRLAARLREPDPETAAPVVVGGDLNAVPESDEVRLLTGLRAGPVPHFVFHDCWRQVSEEPGYTWVRENPLTAHSAWPQRRLDYILVSWPRARPLGNPVSAFVFGDSAVDGVWPSDHLGVAVDLSMGAVAE